MAYLGTKPANSPLTSELIPDGIITPADLSQGKPVWDTSGNVGIGTSSPQSKFDIGITAASNSGAVLSLNASEVARWTANTSTGEIRFGQSIASAGNYFQTFYTTGVERMRIDTSGNFQTFSVNAMRPAYDCRAWVNFNGTGTVAIRASGNVSSITDNGTGDYTVNFATAMADANYQVSGIGCSSTSNAFGFISLGTAVLNGTDPTASLVRVRTTTSNGGNYADVPFVNVAIHR